MIPAFLLALAVFLRILSNPVGNVAQKQLTNQGHHPLLVNFLTYFLLSVGCLVLAVGINWGALPPSFWWHSLAVGITGALGNAFLVKALQGGDLSVLGPINSYKSVIGMIAGIFLLGEIPGLWGVAGIALIIYGSYFVLDTTEEKFSWALLQQSAIQYRIWAMILTAIEAVFIKKVIIASDTTTAFVAWCFFGALFSFALLPIYRLQIGSEIKKIKRTDFTKYGLLVLCIGTMQYTTNYVFDNMPVGYALSLFQLSTLVSVFLGYKIFAEKDMGKKLVGAAIMIVGSVVIILL